MKSIFGRCSCSQVEYQIQGDPLFTHACHCTQCQRRSGGAFCMSTMVVADQLVSIRGVTREFEIAADSGNLKVNHFCDRCGTMLFGRGRARPKVLFFRPGTFDDTRRVSPQAHIWIRSRQPWTALPDDIPCFETSYEIESVWPDSSLRRLRDAK